MDMRPIPGFPCYFATADGHIWTIKAKGGNARTPGRTGAPRELSSHVDKMGYYKVNLDLNGKTFSRAVHRLVLETFIGPRPIGQEACHYPDHRKCNNALSNLRWDTHAENKYDHYRDKTRATQKRCRRCDTTKPVSEFYPDKRASDGLYGNCKICHKTIAIACLDPEKRRIANREYMRRWRKTRAHQKTLSILADAEIPGKIS